MVDFETLDGCSPGNDSVKRGAELWNVPLSVAELIELPADRVPRRDRKCLAKRAVREADGQVGLEHEKAFTDCLHDIQWNDFAHGGYSCTPSDDGVHLLERKTTILLESPRQPPACSNHKFALGYAVGNVYYRHRAQSPGLGVCLGKVKSEARPDQLITFTRCVREALPIEDRDLPSAARNQTVTFQLAGSVRDGWPLDTQHLGEQALSDQQHVIVAAVTHHEQPARQPLLEAVRTVACYGHQDLFEKSVDVGIHEDFGRTASSAWPV